MFENLNNKKNEEEKVEDIFEESDKAPENLPKKEDVTLNNIPVPGSDSSDKAAESKKFLKRIIVVIVILTLVGVSAYFVYSKLLLPRALNVTLEENTNTDPVINNEPVEENNIVEDEPEEIIDNNFEESLIDESDDEIIDIESDHDLALNLLKNIDTDGDGLSDYDELYIYNTDPYNVDTDSDSLSDYEEIMILGTDSLNSDSDGDGFLDGEEASNCYNPLGDGALNLNILQDPQGFAELFPEIMEKCNLSL